MSVKKDPGRFTIKFNICDPMQTQAMEILEQQGRRKAIFLANAILCYIQSSDNGGIKTVPQLTDQALEERIRRIIAKDSTDTVPISESPDAQVSELPAPQEDQLDALFATTELSAIADTLAAFGKN